MANKMPLVREPAGKNNKMVIGEYIKILDNLQTSCAKMILEASKFKRIHFPPQETDIFDTDEWGASIQCLAESIETLRKSMNEVHKKFRIPKRPTRIVVMNDGSRKEMWT